MEHVIRLQLICDKYQLESGLFQKHQTVPRAVTFNTGGPSGN